jgi:cell division protein FtsB
MREIRIFCAKRALKNKKGQVCKNYVFTFFLSFLKSLVTAPTWTLIIIIHSVIRREQQAQYLVLLETKIFKEFLNEQFSGRGAIRARVRMRSYCPSYFSIFNSDQIQFSK